MKRSLNFNWPEKPQKRKTRCEAFGSRYGKIKRGWSHDRTCVIGCAEKVKNCLIILSLHQNVILVSLVFCASRGLEFLKENALRLKKAPPGEGALF